MMINRELIGKETEARIISYSYKNGYGFARTIDGKDVFISSYHVGGSKIEKALFFGSKISFKYGMFKDRICATEIRLLEQYPSGSILEIETVEGPWQFAVETILKVGKSQLIKNPTFLEDVLKEEDISDDYISEGYEEKDFVCLFVETKNGKVYRFFDTESKLHGNGHLKVSKVYTSIYEEFFT